MATPNTHANAQDLYRGILLKPNHTVRFQCRNRGIPQTLSGRSMVQQFQMDTAIWYGTLTVVSAHGNQQNITRLLKRLFLTIQRVGPMAKVKHGGNETWMPWYSHPGGNGRSAPLSSILSHGGRVLIQLPKNDNHAFWSWLWTGPAANRDLNPLDPNQHTRAGATHAIETYRHTRQKTTVLGTVRKYMNEKGGTGAAMRSATLHHGINIASGGWHNTNPFSDQQIIANGAHGHLYLGYRPATANDYGGILVGCEDSAPVDIWNPDVFNHHGHKALAIKAKTKSSWVPTGVTQAPVDGEPPPYQELHAGWCRGQTGHEHRVGGSGKFSVTGGKKWKDLSWHPNIGPCSKKDACLIDLITYPLVYTGIMAMNHNDFDPQHLGRDCNAPATQPIQLQHFMLI